MTRPTVPPSLKATRARNLCDEDGLVPAVRRALASGRLPGYLRPKDYLDDVLEGRAHDDIASFGWALCRFGQKCTRTGRCLRHEPGQGHQSMPAARA